MGLAERIQGLPQGGHYSERVGWAVAYALRLHAAQRRKGKTEPYLSHVLQVVALIARYGGDEDQMIAGALHDVPEDCGGLPRLREIGHLFGPRVEMMVADCSDSLTIDAENKAPFRERKIAHLQHAAHDLSRDSALVAVCDKVANLGDLVRDRRLDGDETLERFNGGAEGTRAYYASMLAVLADQLEEDSPAIADFRHLLEGLGAEPVPTGEDPVACFERRTQHLSTSRV